MKKILWISNNIYSDLRAPKNGGWQISMAEELLKTEQLQIWNISEGNVDVITAIETGCNRSWIIPKKFLRRNYRHNDEVIKLFRKIELDYKPDLVHIWGTEQSLTKIAVEYFPHSKILLEIQGVLNACNNFYYGALTAFELFSCIGLKEIILPKRHLFFRKRNMASRAMIEAEIIKKVNNISVPSKWARSYIYAINPACNIYESGLLLRKEFYGMNLSQWTPRTDGKIVVLTSILGINSYKGLHVLYRGFATFSRDFPNSELRIIGGILDGRIIDGYSKWLLKLAKKLGIDSSIKYLGALNASEIINELLESSMFVIPSYVESYCVALAEAMIIGAPVVAAYSGAMPEFSDNNDTALFFTPGDSNNCAWQMRRIAISRNLALSLSSNAQKTGSIRSNLKLIVQNQLNIYNKIIYL